MKYLRFDGILYLEMKEGETEEDSVNRLLELLDNVGIELGVADTEIIEE